MRNGESYYDTLGISKDANESDIKKAFRTMSLKYHPDRNPGEDTTEKFQKINEAYETLSDPEKKHQYDNESNGMPFGMGGMPGGPGAFRHMDSMNEFTDINNIFNMMFNGMGGPGGPGMHGMPGMGGPGIRIFHNGPNGPQVFHHVQKPAPIVKHIELTLKQAYDGGNIPVDIERFVVNNNIKYHERQTINIPIHRGIDKDSLIIIENEGNSINNTVKGDIKIHVKITDDPVFRRDGNDLNCKKVISLKQALCGFEIDIQHLNGKMLHLNNRSNRTIITPETKKIIPSLGMVHEEEVGNLIIEFQIDFPQQLTEEQLEVISGVL